MTNREDDIRSNKNYFEHKLRATKQLNDVIHKAQTGNGSFLLLDTRTRDAFAKGHIQGAWCAPLAELPALARELPRDMELVTYCWKDT